MTEFERQEKVLDMMITAHSVLRDRYLLLSLLFDNSLLIASVVLNAFVFIDASFITKISGISEEKQKLVLGVSSIIVFAITVVLLQVKWKEKAENHSKSSSILFALLHECRMITNLPEGDQKDIAIIEFQKKYKQVNTDIVKIPESNFNTLKLKHYRKIELSKLIDKNPGSRLFILKIKLFLSSLKKRTHIP